MAMADGAIPRRGRSMVARGRALAVGLALVAGVSGILVAGRVTDPATDSGAQQQRAEQHVRGESATTSISFHPVHRHRLEPAQTTIGPRRAL